MNSDLFDTSENDRFDSRYVLFTTNRQVDYWNEIIARRTKGAVLRYEDIFKNEISNGLLFGLAKVTYPRNRKLGDQSYATDSAHENPLFTFTLVGYKLFTTPEEFKNAIEGVKSEPNDRSLLYVPGIDNSFSNGIERLTQLSIDLGWRGPPLLFSWPSDHFRLIDGTSLIGLSESSYLETSRIAWASSRFLDESMDQLSASKVTFDLLAHSMGSEVVFGSLSSRPSPSLADGSPATLLSLPSVILAAPDVSTSDFMRVYSQKLTRSTRHITVYCSDDLMLNMASRVRHSDERLGYCVAPKPAPGGLEIVRVTGTAQDFANHSYYIISPDMLNDMRRVFLFNPSVTLPVTTQGMPRELKLGPGP